MLSAAILATSHYFQTLDDAESLPTLDAALREVCRKRYRRVDRFVQLALLGSARCVMGKQPKTSCGVYLGSDGGPLSSNIDVQQTMLAEQDLPAPFSFVNTLGSSAVFNVADNLGLHGPALCVSRRRGSFEAMLTTALLDIESGAVEQALVGVVEEAPLPPAIHRKRLGVPIDRPLAEGSHWWWLGRASGDAGARLELHPNLECTTLLNTLSEQAQPESALCLGRTVDASVAERLCEDHPSAEKTLSMPCHDSIEAAWLMEQSEACWLVTGSADARMTLLHCAT